MLAVVEDAVDPAVVVVAVEDAVAVCNRGVYVDGSIPAYAPPDNITNL